MTGFDRLVPLPDTPSERRVRLLLDSLETSDHDVRVGGTIRNSADLLAAGAYQLALDAFWIHGDGGADGANNRGCAYALARDWEQARATLERSMVLGTKAQLDRARFNHWRVVLAEEAAVDG